MDGFGINQGKYKANVDKLEGNNGQSRVIKMANGAKLLMQVIEKL